MGAGESCPNLALGCLGTFCRSAPRAMPCDVENLCLELIDGSRWGVALEVAIGVYSFVGIAHVADAHLCTSLETLCARWQIPDDVAGASFLSFGSAGD